MPYKSPQEIAELIEEAREDSHAEIADLLGVSRAAVTQALGSPSKRRIKLLARIADLYGIEVDPDSPYYPTDKD